jgi:hypothetical protein
MLNSWSTVMNENKNTSDFFNPLVPQMGRDPNLTNNGASKEDYQKYGWLFGSK